ncbi:von Willebrand factor type A domain protein [Polystyrenella longa]|uniref:von Willebrand factor type A domain protein n=1 Tax=Polystyrenella longa TaxID=2528007 RepID=A0A518CLF6_9PLAN|nr:VWA domain-containing protein [Polystyrenella longa]QDU80057.1 von Willebrand factor type A domain protein [Polystyrenella longa]
MFAFTYPWIFFLLPLPWLAYKLLPAHEKRPISVRVPFGARLKEVLASGGYTHELARHSTRWLVPVLLWLLVLTALAKPQWIEPPIVKELPTRDLLLLVDLSASMQQKDFVNDAGKSVSRLGAVKEVLGSFLERRKGDRVGLVVFGDAPYLQAPFSTDLTLSRELLDECGVGMAGPKTAFGDAIGLGVNLFDNSDVPAKTIIALTDGNDTKSQVRPVEAARVASQRNIRIHTVAIGDPTTVGEDKLDTQELKDVASTADGSFFFASDRKQLEGIYGELDKIETRKVNSVSHRPRRDLYYFFVAAALLISLLKKCFVMLRRKRGEVRNTKKPEVRVNPVNGQLEVVS